MGIDQMRERYRRIRASAECYVSPKRPSTPNFNEEVQNRADAGGVDLDPQGWLHLAWEVHEDWRKAWEKDKSMVRCDRCGGTGIFSKVWLNGRPVSNDPCFRCEGKGRQDRDDMRRNCYYDLYGISWANHL